jgi:hypothetical protein
MRTDGNVNAAESKEVGLDALKGAFAGAAAVWVMDRVDWFMFKKQGAAVRAATRKARPGGLDPSHVAAKRVATFFGKELQPAQPNKPGIAIHYNLGIGPGALYSVLVDRVPMIGKGRGLIYGLGLFLMQDEAINAASGLSGKPQLYPWQDHARGLVAHLVYGFVMDAGVRTLKKMTRSGAHMRQEYQQEAEGYPAQGAWQRPESRTPTAPSARH